MRNTTRPTEERISDLDCSYELIAENQDFLLKIEPKAVATAKDLISVATQSLPFIEAQLLHHGAILFRNFSFDGDDLKKFADALYPNSPPTDYRGGQAMRTKVQEEVYLATSAPKAMHLPHHHEMSYLPVEQAPTRLFFVCAQPAEKGGETPLCFDRTFLKHIDPAIVDRIRSKRVRYIRNLYPEWVPGWGPGWTEAYQTTDKKETERICEWRGIDWKWKDGDVLYTTTNAQGTCKHPKTGEEVWFNSAYHLNASTGISNELTPHYVSTYGLCMTPDMLDTLRKKDPDDLPFNTLYGDGTFLEPELLAEIHTVLMENQVSVPWQKGDLILIDNMLTSHSRNPFEGERKVLVTWKS